MADPVSDLLTRIRNAIGARHETVDVPASRLKTEIVRILKQEGYIAGFADSSETPGILRIQLRYAAGKGPVIGSMNRISKPGCRVYAGKNEIPEVMGGLGINIISTSQGIMTGKEAKEKGLGGEVICSVS